MASPPNECLATWAIAQEATSPEAIALRQALHGRYLEPFLTTQGQYLAHLESLYRGVSVRPIQGVPILLFASELPEEEDNQFIRWVYRKRHLSSVPALRASADVADVRLERNSGSSTPSSRPEASCVHVSVMLRLRW